MNIPEKEVKCPECNEDFLESRAYKFDIDNPREVFLCPHCREELGAKLKGQSIKRFYFISGSLCIIIFTLFWYLSNVLVNDVFGYSEFNSGFVVGMFASFKVYDFYKNKQFPKLVITPNNRP